MDSTMRLDKGLTTWVLKLGPVALIWRWNMSLADALRTYAQRRFGRHGYVAAGPILLEW